MTVFSPPAAVRNRLTLMGRLIQAAREERRLSQTALAERVGASRPTIQRLEAGRESVAWGTVLTACWVLGLPSDPDTLSEGRRAELLLKGEQIHRVRQRGVDDDF